MQNGVIIALVIIVIAVIGLFLLYGSGSSSTSTQTTSPQTQYTSTYTTAPSSATSGTPVVMTDPPYAPAGTSAEVITYSDVMVHTTGPNGGWVAANGSGSLDFASTTSSSSQVMANVNLAANSSVNAVQYTIDSAYVVVNGTDTAVTVTNPTVTANVSGNVSSNSAIIIYTSPTVVATYNQNSTTYVMQPSSRAVVAANAGVSSNANVGSTFALSSSANAQVSASAPNITITSASISTSGNTTSISVTIKNNGNSAVVLNNVLIYGKQAATASSGSGLGLGLNLSVGSLLSAVVANVTASNELAFTTSGSVPLALTTSSSGMASSGTIVNSSYSTTLTYTGNISYDSGHVSDSLSSGSQYMIVVTGSGGAAASTTVTAT